MLEIPTNGISDGGLASKAPSGPESRRQITESAKQFEALLIGQIMRSMRESSGGWLGTGEDKAGATMAEYAEQQMAQLLSTNGGFGLASLIEQGLSQRTQPQRLNDEASPKSLPPA